MSTTVKPEMKTAVDLARAAGVNPKHFRAWLREEKQNPNSPLRFDHEKGSDWLFSPLQALVVLFVFHATHGRIDVEKTFKQLSQRP